MAYSGEGVDRLAGTALQRRGGRGIGSPFHQLRSVESGPSGEPIHRQGLRLVRIFRRAREQAVHRSDTSTKEELHGQRIDRLQQYRERLRLAVGGMSGLLFAEES